MPLRIRDSAFTALIFLSISAAHSQTGTVRGKVVDAEG
jgi:hypothetical protein